MGYPCAASLLWIILLKLRSVFLALSLVVATPAQAQTLPPAAIEPYDALLDGNGRDPGLALVRNGNTADNELGGTIHGDSFNGAGGNDVLVGYESRDTYIFKPGDGLDTIFDLSPEGSVIRFRGGVDPDLVTEELVPGWNGETDRVIRYGEADAIRIIGWSRLSDAEKAAWTVEIIPPPAPRATDYRDGPDRSAEGGSSTNLVGTFLRALFWGIGVGIILIVGLKALAAMRPRA